jgi:hypothetical protein
MKVDKVVFSSDDSDYLNFWPHVAEITERTLGILPVLFWITDEGSDFYFDDYGLVKKIKKSSKMESSHQAQVFRMFGCKYFAEEVCMTSDIDMFFYNREYLESCLEGISDDDWVIIGSDGYDPKRPECVFPFRGPDRYSICYNISKGRNFENVLETKGSFEGYINKLQIFKTRFEQDNGVWMNLWNLDEFYYGTKINKQIDINIHKIKRGARSSFWMPRHIYKKDFITTEEKKNSWPEMYLDLWQDWGPEFYIDCHCPKFSEYRDLILKVKNDILLKF